MRTDDYLRPFVNKRVRVTLDSGTDGAGVLWCDDDGAGRQLYTLAESGPAKGDFFTADMQFYASDVDEVEPL
jgi:hypothetical protein